MDVILSTGTTHSLDAQNYEHRFLAITDEVDIFNFGEDGLNPIDNFALSEDKINISDILPEYNEAIAVNSLLSFIEEGSLQAHKTNEHAMELIAATGADKMIHVDINFDSDVFTATNLSLERDQAQLLLKILTGSNG